MRTAFKISILILFVFTIASCCTKKYCLSFEETNTLYFKGFSIDEVDSIIVQRYAKNTNFNQRIDSLLITTQPNNYNSSLLSKALPYNLNTDMDLKVMVLSNNAIFTIKALNTLKNSCNNCAVAGSGDLYSYLSSYQVNNTTYNDVIITLIK